MSSRQSSRTPGNRGISSSKNSRGVNNSVGSSTSRGLNSSSRGRAGSSRGRGKDPANTSTGNLFNSPFQTISNLLRTPNKKNSLDIAVAEIPISNPVSRETSYTDLNIGGNKPAEGVLQKTSTANLPLDNHPPDITPPIQNLNLPDNSNLINISNTDTTLSGNTSNMAGDDDIPLATGQERVDNAVDPVILALQQTVLSSQEEVRRELNAIKGTIAVLSQANTSGLSNAQSLPPPHNNSNTSDNNTSCCSVRPIKFKEWNIKYDGVGRVSDFLFKIETLSARSKCSEEQLMDNIHMFLSDKAEDWFWLFIKQNPTANFPFFKYSISKRFGSLESDHDVVVKISLRKQGPRELYDDFHTAIVTMNSRLGEPIADRKLIDIIKGNLTPNLKYMLFNSESNNLETFRQTARNAEKLLHDNKNMTPFSSNRNVNEIDNFIDESENDPQIEALRIDRRQIDYSKLKCWNCSKSGHSYLYCPVRIETPFCFKCGQPGVLTPDCPKQHMGNYKKSELLTGDPRSSH